MSAKYAFSLLVLLCCVACNPVTTVPRSSGRLYVSPGPGTRQAPYFDGIQDALDYAAGKSGGAIAYTITVEPGVYRENLRLRTPRITLEGTSRDLVIVQPPPGHYVSPQVLIEAGGITLRGLTIDGLLEDPERVKYNMYVHLAGGHDDVLVEDCRFRRTRVGVSVKAAIEPAEFNENIVFRGNLFESSQTAIRVDATDLGENQGRIDFTSRDNRMVLRNVDDDENILAVLVRRLHWDSRFRSLGDTFDLESSHTRGRGDVQAYMFHDWIPAISEILGPRIRAAHNGRANAHQGLFAVKIHNTELNLPDRPHVVYCSDMQVHLVDKTRRRVGGAAHIGYNGADKVVLLVSGGTLTHDLEGAGGMQMRTFSVDPHVKPPYGIFYAGLPVENAHHVSRSDGLIQQLERRRPEVTREPDGRKRTDQIGAAPTHSDDTQDEAQLVAIDDSQDGRRLCVALDGEDYCTPVMTCAGCGDE